MVGKKRTCWKCGDEIETEGLAFEIHRFGISYNPPDRLLRVCEKCWQPIKLALEEAGYEIRETHTVDLISHARSGAQAVRNGNGGNEQGGL